MEPGAGISKYLTYCCAVGPTYLPDKYLLKHRAAMDGYVMIAPRRVSRCPYRLTYLVRHLLYVRTYWIHLYRTHHLCQVPGEYLGTYLPGSHNLCFSRKGIPPTGMPDFTNGGFGNLPTYLLSVSTDTSPSNRSLTSSPLNGPGTVRGTLAVPRPESGSTYSRA